MKLNLNIFNGDLKKKILLLANALKKTKNVKKIKFFILYGSQDNGKANKLSDYDFCIYYDGNNRERFNFRLNILGNLGSEFDIQIFQDLPIFVRKEVLKGKVIYCQDEDQLYDIAYQTIKEFEHFKKYYYDYLNRRPVLKW